MDVVRLFDEHVFPVCSPALLQGQHPLREPSDLRHHTLLHLEWAPSEGKWPDWQAWLLAAGVRDVDFTRGPRFTWHAMALQAAIQGQGIALASTPIVNDDLEAGRLVCPFDRSISTRFGYYFVCLPDLAQSRKIQAFREWLLHEAQLSLGEQENGDGAADDIVPALAANQA
jgi:LysR family glycine cleavage system transcriptional activator